MIQYIILLITYTWCPCYFVELLKCLISGFHTVSLFCYYEGNSGYINSDYSDVRCMVYIWGFSCLDYFFDVLISWSRKFCLYDWFCLYSILSVLWCFLSLGDNSGYINSGYGDVRYRVYIWGFPYLDYFFDVLISQIGNWACITSFVLFTSLDILLPACITV